MVGPAEGAAILTAVTVFQAVAVPRLFTITHLGAAGVAGNAQVIELATVGVQVQGKAAIAGFQFAGAAAGGVGPAIAQLAGTLNTVDGRGGNAVIKAIDHSTNGVAAIEQGSGTTDDFDALNGRRVQRYGVIVGQRRRIQGTDTIAQNTDAVAIQAADHRTTGPGAEPGRSDAGLVVQGLAEATFLLQGQVVTFEHCRGGSQLAVTQRVGGDDLGFELHSLTQWRSEPQGGGDGRESKGQVTHGRRVSLAAL
ncbi:hypothetical protein D3C72_1278410 [compost metagenome]